MRRVQPLRPVALVVALLGLAACSDYPRDTDGTLDDVRGGEIRVGWSQDARSDPQLAALARRLADGLGARMQVQGGTAEPLLLRLEAGELDLVLGHFAPKSPWMKRVTFSRPLATHEVANSIVETVAATRNGEHAFSMEVDRAVIALKGEPQ